MKPETPEVTAEGVVIVASGGGTTWIVSWAETGSPALFITIRV